MTDLNKITNANNLDIRCGEILTIRLNCNQYESMYIDVNQDQDEYQGQLESIEYKDDKQKEAVWYEINQSASHIFEKLWSSKWERDQEILYRMEEIFNDYKVEFNYYKDEE